MDTLSLASITVVTLLCVLSDSESSYIIAVKMPEIQKHPWVISCYEAFIFSIGFVDTSGRDIHICISSTAEPYFL